MLTNIIAVIIGIIGFLFMLPNDTLPVHIIFLSMIFGLTLICISMFLMAKYHEKHVLKYFHLHFIHPYGYDDRHVKAYSYAGRRKAIHDLAQEGYVLYTESEITYDD